MIEKTYRSEIDGLRAIAIISVLLYHFKFSIFESGYLGVDIFFVISGYLITKLIRKEYLVNSHFDYVNFYTRRARRLFPAFVVTIVVTALFAFVLFSPDHLKRFSGALFSAPFGLSNIYFWSESDYFDAQSHFKPLLHTWSLAIEEQYYLLWPVLLIFILNKVSEEKIKWLVLFGIILGLLANYLFLVYFNSSYISNIFGAFADNKSSSVFYLLPFRIYEFLLGGIVVWVEHKRPQNFYLRELLVLSGFLFVSYSLLSTANTITNSISNAFVACLGVFLILWFYQGSKVTVFLESKLFVYIGKISYSLYLVHWPIFVFYRYYIYGDLSLIEKIILLVLSLMLAVLLNKYIENPVRYRKYPSKYSGGYFIVICLLSSTAVSIVAYQIWDNGGLNWRLPNERVAIKTFEQNKFEEDRFCLNNLGESSENIITCSYEKGFNETIYVWGDSHARHLIPGLVLNYPGYNVSIMYYSGCPAQSGFSTYIYQYWGEPSRESWCITRNNKALEFFKNLKIKSNIIISSYLTDEMSRNENFISSSLFIFNTLSKYGHNVRWLGDVVPPLVELNDCMRIPKWFDFKFIKKRCHVDPLQVERLVLMHNRLNKIIGESFYINPIKFLHSKDEGYIPFIEGQEVIFRDRHHLTVNGSSLFIKSVANNLNYKKSDEAYLLLND